MADFDWGGAFQGLLGGMGYDKMRGDLQDTGRDIQGQLGDVTQGIQDRTSFQPWGVTGPVGQTNYTQDGMNQELSGSYQDMSNRFRYGGTESMMQAMLGDRSQREQGIYDQIRAMQQPGEQRAAQGLQNQGLAQGRAGMFTNQYGGTPEQHAQAMAQAEAQNAAAYSAMGQASQEAQTQYNMGQGLMNESYRPLDYMNQQAGQGLNYGQLQQQGNTNASQLLAQMGLGGAGVSANLANMDSQMFSNMMQAFAPLMGAGGDLIGEGVEKVGGSIWDTIMGFGDSSKLFG